ncbi:carbon-nitrogen hydrolase family protein [Candidatus Magnetaquicoccus inordinatus]|uniref:carbon-nitrogen hydrolase family protein n=1 Tax=Candidatus Magnetaquicoccus inordinatus TaxID=2496818 RepID=UPI001D0F223A|nr:carbon-nitrogen hydrolase family protein [Candidatus Magnetaquicoccus inordinatus]
MRAAVIQMCSSADREQNLLEAGALMESACKQGAGLLLLPENFSFMGRSDAEKLQHREDVECSPSLQFLQEFAARHQVWVVGGSIALQVAGSESMTNSCFVVDASGRIQARYDKIHLFDVDLAGESPYRESDRVKAGDRAVVVATPFARLGLTICYDLRFPELFQALSGMGAEVITVPAAFTQVTGQAHWEVLLRARAIENFSYILAAGQGGSHANGRRTHGHSMIIEPWGQVVAQCPEGKGFAIAELDAERIQRSRQRIPCLQHRRAFTHTFLSG